MYSARNSVGIYILRILPPKTVGNVGAGSRREGSMYSVRESRLGVPQIEMLAIGTRCGGMFARLVAERAMSQRGI